MKQKIIEKLFQIAKPPRGDCAIRDITIAFHGAGPLALLPDTLIVKEGDVVTLTVRIGKGVAEAAVEVERKE